MLTPSSHSAPLHLPAMNGGMPSHWEWARLEEVCLGIFDCPHSTPQYTDYGPYVARSQDIRSGVFRLEEAAHVSEDTYLERVSRARPQYGDLLYSREGTYFGIAAEVPPDTRVCLGQRMVLLRPSPERLHFRFLRYWLNSPVLSRHIEGFRDGSVAERLNLPTIRNLPVPVPPLTEQRAIASILGALDDKIELNRRMNETLEAMARAVFKSWFADGESNQHQPLSHLADIVAGQSPPGETYNESGEGWPFYQGIRDFGFRFPSRRVYCTSPTRYANPGDVLLSVRAPVGSLNVAWERCAIGRGIAALREHRGRSSFLYYALLSEQMGWRQFDADGTVFGAVTRDQIAQFRVPAAEDDRIDGFERIASPIDQIIALNARAVATLARIRDILVPKLLSGDLRVHQAERLVESVV